MMKVCHTSPPPTCLKLEQKDCDPSLRKQRALLTSQTAGLQVSGLHFVLLWSETFNVWLPHSVRAEGAVYLQMDRPVLHLHS